VSENPINHGTDVKTYKISFDYENYFNLDLDVEELGDELEDSLGEDEFYNYSWNNLSLKEHWVDIGATFIDAELNNTKNPDITVWNSSNLVLSSSAYDALAPKFESYGEFLPITVDGEIHYVFNCLNAVEADKTKSQADIDNDLWMGVKSIGFSDEIVANNLIFKTRFDRCSALYCGQVFKDLVQSLGLEGLLFTEDLVSDF
jgi:hypothetical protein